VFWIYFLVLELFVAVFVMYVDIRRGHASILCCCSLHTYFAYVRYRKLFQVVLTMKPSHTAGGLFLNRHGIFRRLTILSVFPLLLQLLESPSKAHPMD